MEGERVAGRYRVETRLGAGGMGVVYLARDEKLERDVALKALSSSQLGDSRGRARLLREARSAAKLEHPSIVQVYDVVETDDGGACIVMERVRGRSLRTLLEDGPLPLDRVAHVVAAIAEALGAAHDEGIVHRDVKPDNAMVRTDGRVVVLDFGLVKDVGRTGESISNSPTLEQLTKSGAVVGTPAYLAPEQARGKGAEPASDQFALGVVAYELLTGRLPFEAESPTQMLAMILMDDPPPATSVRPELPAEVDGVLARALSKQPEERFADVRNFADALAEALGGEAQPVRAAAGPRRPIGRALVAGLVAAVVVAGAAALWAMPSEGPEGEGEAGVPTPLGEPDATLACPILEVEGVAEPTGWLGAAAADMLCQRAELMLGGRPGTTVVPAEALDLPPLANRDFPQEPFEGDARTRTLERAASADAWIDGVVRHDDGRFELSLELLTPQGRVAEGRAEASSMQRAAIEVLDRWAESGAVPLAEDVHPDVARWTGFETVVDALRMSDFDALFFAGSQTETQCRGLLDWFLREEPGSASQLASFCAPYVGPIDAPAPRLDDSSVERIVQTLSPVASSLSDEEAERIGRRLREARAHEPDEIGEAALAEAEGILWAQRGDNERAIPLLQAALRRDPRSRVQAVAGVPPARVQLGRALFGTDGFETAELADTAWDPSNGEAWRGASLFEEDPARTSELLRRSALLGPDQAVLQAQYGAQLVQTGRREEARSLASRLLTGDEHLHLAGTFLETRVLADEVRFEQSLEKARGALEALDRFGDAVNADFFLWHQAMMVAEILGRRQEVSDWLVERFVLAEPHRLATHDVYYEQLVAPACIHASPPIARRCLDRLEELARGRPGGTLPPLAAIKTGARRYIEGDMRGAAEAWPPLVGQFWASIPVEPFEVAGMPDLVERFERRHLEQPPFSGVSMAHVREAKRAHRRGDHDRARELADRVLDRWAVADAHVPAVQEMRDLLEELPPPG